MYKSLLSKKLLSDRSELAEDWPNEKLPIKEKAFKDPKDILPKSGDELLSTKKKMEMVGEVTGTKSTLSLHELKLKLEVEGIFMATMNKCLKLDGEVEVARKQCNKVEVDNTNLRHGLKHMQEKVQQSETLVREAKQKLLAEQEDKASLLEEVAKLKEGGVLSSSVHSREVQELGHQVQELRQQVQVLKGIEMEDFLQKEKLVAIVEMIRTKLANNKMQMTQLKAELKSLRKSSKSTELKLPDKQKASKSGVSTSKRKVKLMESGEKFHIPGNCLVNQLQSNYEALGEEFKLPKQIEKTVVSKEGGIRKNQSRNLDQNRILYQDRWVSLSTILEDEQVALGLKLESHLIKVSEVVQETIGDREAGAKRTSQHRNLARVKDEKEREDLQHQNWREMKEASSDRARKDLAWRTFQNPVKSDPSTNLSFHGFKGHGHCLPTVIRRCEISEGRLIPVSGGKRKKRDSFSDPQRSKVIRMSDFGRVMRSKFAEIFTERGNISQEGIENFTTFLKHHRDGQDETASFLTFYAGRKGAYLTEQQAWEVLGMEEWFSKILQVCGEVDAVRCKTCEESHKFSL